MVEAAQNRQLRLRHQLVKANSDIGWGLGIALPIDENSRAAHLLRHWPEIFRNGFDEDRSQITSVPVIGAPEALPQSLPCRPLRGQSAQAAEGPIAHRA